MACLVLFFLVGGVVPAVVFSATPEFAPGPETVATSVGLVSQGASVGLLVGPPAAAAVVTAMGGWSAMLVFLSIASTATIVSALFCAERSHRTCDWRDSLSESRKSAVQIVDAVNRIRGGTGR